MYSQKSRGIQISYSISPPAILIPLVYTVRGLGLGNTFIGIILPYISFNVPFSIVLSRAFFKTFPKELEEAARMDGISDLGVSFRKDLPLAPVIVILLLF